MADALSEFEIPVAEDYRLVEILMPHHNGRGVVIAALGNRSATRIRPFSPEHAFLFREFAQIPENDANAILGFVRTYGYLGRPMTFEATLDDDTDDTAETVRPEPVEALSGWRDGYLWGHQIASMAIHVELWGFIQKADVRGVNAWVQKRGVSWRRLLYDADSPMQLDADPLRNATECLRIAIDDHLRWTGVGPRVVWARTEDRLRLSHVPRSLLGALWLQFALAVTEDRTVRKCKHCERIFEVSKEPTGARTRGDSDFCSINCKSADYRRRRTTAKKMRRAGASIRQILAAVAAPKADQRDAEKTVRGWIAGIDGPRKRERR